MRTEQDQKETPCKLIERVSSPQQPMTNDPSAFPKTCLLISHKKQRPPNKTFVFFHD